MRSHSVTCHPTEVRIPPLPRAEAGTRFSYPGGMQGWVDLCYVKATCRELNPRPVNRKFNALPLSHHATIVYALLFRVSRLQSIKYRSQTLSAGHSAKSSSNFTHSLHHLLPLKISTYRPYQLRKRQHPYLLPTVQYSQFKNCYINRCLFKYV